MKKLSLILMLVCTAAISFTQTYEPPKDYKFESAEDYDTYQEDAIEAMDYLISAPIEKATENTRKEAFTFMFVWISGHPTVSVTLFALFTDYTKKNPTLLMPYMAGLFKSFIDNPVVSNTEANLNGVKAALKVYQMGGDIKKDKKVEELIKWDSEGKLEDWISSQVNQ